MSHRIALVLLSLLLLLGSQIPTAGGADAVSGQNLQVDSPEYDFGTADETQQVEHIFTLKNRGTSTIEIRKVEQSCGCTTTLLPNTKIPPGGSVPLTARINLKNRRGAQNKTITLYSNDPQQPQLVLRITGLVTTEIDIIPSKVDFMDVRTDQSASREVKIVNNAQNPLRITQVETAGAFFSAKLVTLEEGRTYLVKVQTVPPLNPGTTRGSIFLGTDNPKYLKINIPVTTQIPLDVVAVPSVLTVNTGGKNKLPTTFFVALKSRSNKAFKILKVEPPLPEITSRIEADGPSAYKLEISNVVPSVNLNNKWLVVTTDNPGAKEVRVPFRLFNAQPSPTQPLRMAPSTGTMKK